MIRKYYASGIEISSEEKNQILHGKRDKLIRYPPNQPGIPLGWVSDYFNVKDDMLDKSDPLLVETLKEIGLSLEKTFIIQIFLEKSDISDPLNEAKKGCIYGYF